MVLALSYCLLELPVAVAYLSWANSKVLVTNYLRKLPGIQDFR